MDKSWINKYRDTLKYELGVENFLLFAEENASNPKKIHYPCSKCVNFKEKSIKVIRGHLYAYGFSLSYTNWMWHGEPTLSSCASAPSGLGIPQNPHFGYETIDICQVAFNEGDYDEESYEFNKFVEEAERSLFEDSEHTKLDALVQLHNLKARFGMSDTCFSELLATVGSLLPKDNVLPQTLYEAKKTLTNLGLQYEKIHACPKDCILYRKEFSDETTCPKCGVSRWKLKKDKTVNVGFKRMFKSATIAEMLTWHDDKRPKDGYMRHPADSPAWKLVDYKWPEFASESRNLRLALSADGINPHSSMSSRYSCWPPGNDINIYLEPLIDDLRTLWDGVNDVYDAHTKEYFTLRAVLLWTIHDFPAYGNLSECTTKGYKACPICGDKTFAIHLAHYRKMSYGSHYSVAACLDMLQMGVRHNLGLKIGEKRTYFPAAPYTLSRAEKIKMCTSLLFMKVPDGHSSNIKNLVSMDDLKLYGLKSHDCHMLMQQLLPVAIRSVLPKHVRISIMRLCFFFNALCTKVVDVSKWMYPFERFMKVLKGYVRNRFHPEGCIAESYLGEESIEFCSEFLQECSTIGVPKGPCKLSGPLSGAKLKSLAEEERDLEHLHVLSNNAEVDPYKTTHKKIFEQLYVGKKKSKKWLLDEHNCTFAEWFQSKVSAKIKERSNGVSQALRWLAGKPSFTVFTYERYRYNGVKYFTKQRDNARVVQNSGVTLVAKTMQVSSAKDKNPVESDMTFYGVIEEIWKLDYHDFKVHFFYVDGQRMKKELNKMSLVLRWSTLIGRAIRKTSFAFAGQVKQVFYVENPLDVEWLVVMTTPNRDYCDCLYEDDLGDTSMEHQPFCAEIPLPCDEDENKADATYTRENV
ncbi:uncharacterized protein LOC133723227 [Rosa rugosa]|uniref:uncharacterized protein LOC133723227 n=1 Tax=Rosa rugosa TaxID=74645 RepID=UPI002B40725F|nr:uncharacterized protein LOC133723227 [Rosa rugosa]